MTGFLFITAFTVSIDAFLCGYSLAVEKGKKLKIILGISLTVLIMCLIANYAAVFLSGFLNDKTAALGGVILIAVGIINLIKKDDEPKAKDGLFAKSVATGFAVGLDGAVANLSLALMGINAFYVPVVIAAFHAITITLGILLAKSKLNVLSKYAFLAPVVLVLMGIYKLVSIIK